MRLLIVLPLCACTTPHVENVDDAGVALDAADVDVTDAAVDDVAPEASLPRPKLSCSDGVWHMHSLGPRFAPDAGCDRDTEVCCASSRSNMCAPDRKSECTTLEACKGRAFACWRKSDCAPGEVCCAHKAVVECATSCDPKMIVETRTTE